MALIAFAGGITYFRSGYVSIDNTFDKSAMLVSDAEHVPARTPPIAPYPAFRRTRRFETGRDAGLGLDS